MYIFSLFATYLIIFLSNSDYTASNERKISWKGCGRKWLWLYFKVLYLKELRKTTKTSVRIAGLQVEAGVLTILYHVTCQP
jgi:hypothetical protein